MKLIDNSVELWTPKSYSNKKDVCDFVRRCANVCYQVTTNDKEDSESWLNRVILKHDPKSSIKNHLSIFEHATVYLVIPKKEKSLLKYDKYSVTNTVYGYDFITTNLRVLIENNWLRDFYDCATEPTKHHSKRYTFSFITSIGISRELNRHRCHSITEESTRYCNYSNNRFTDNICFIKPYYWDSLNDNEKHLFMDHIHKTEDIYLLYSKQNFTTQQLREFLPLCTKTQVVHTAFETDWRRFIKLRGHNVSGKAHPHMNYLSDKVEQILNC